MGRIPPPSGKLGGYHYYGGGGCEDVRTAQHGWAGYHHHQVSLEVITTIEVKFVRMLGQLSMDGHG